MVQELSGIETLRTDFIANVSHELKTPLAVIQNYAVMLQQANLPEEQRAEYAKTIVDASCRLSDLITNILKLNKLENQQIYPEKRSMIWENSFASAFYLLRMPGRERILSWKLIWRRMC